MTTVVNKRPARFIGIVVFVSITPLSSMAYEGPQEDSLSLTSAEQNVIDSLTDGSETVPAWVIAQLLDASDRLHPFADEGRFRPGHIPVVSINTILAESARHRGRLCAINVLFISAENVDHALGLPQQDHCWSVIALDDKYATPLQLFTTKRPSGFAKDSPAVVVGYYLASRMDRPMQGDGSQRLTVPVFVGSLILAPAQRQAGGTRFRWFFFGVIVFLVGVYLLVRIYIARSAKRTHSPSLLDSVPRWKRLRSSLRTRPTTLL